MKQTAELLRTEILLSNAWSRGLAILGTLAALALGVVIGRIAGRETSATRADVAEGTRLAAPGPWGELEITPISIACPQELLPVQAFERKVTHWFFKGYTAETLLPRLTEFGIVGELRDQFRAPGVWHEVEGGMDLTPTPEIILNLPPKSRRAIYSLLATFPENNSSLIFVLARTVDERFAGSGVRPETLGTFKRLCCEYGRYLVFSDVASLFTVIPTYEERVAFLKAMTQQPTMLVRLKVDEKTDLTALISYWGNAGRGKDQRPLLESLARVPGGVQFGLVNLLPSGPASRLYRFPLPANPLAGPVIRQDCHWSAFNFFREAGTEQATPPDFILQKLREDYFPVTSDQRYGDLLVFLTPGGSMIHSAVYLADDIVFTKNGDTSMHPWMLSTVRDLLDQYSFQVPPDQKLEVRTYRNKFH